MVRVQLVRAKIPRRRAVCARVGVLEDRLGRPEIDCSVQCDNVLGNGLSDAGSR